MTFACSWFFWRRWWAERFFTEFWRLDSGVLVSWLQRYNALGTPQEHAAFVAAVDAHYRHGGLSIAQWISIVLFVLGVGMAWTRRDVRTEAPPRAISPPTTVK